MEIDILVRSPVDCLRVGFVGPGREVVDVFLDGLERGLEGRDAFGFEELGVGFFGEDAVKS